MLSARHSGMLSFECLAATISRRDEVESIKLQIYSLSVMYWRMATFVAILSFIAVAYGQSFDASAPFATISTGACVKRSAMLYTSGSSTYVVSEFSTIISP